MTRSFSKNCNSFLISLALLIVIASLTACSSSKETKTKTSDSYIAPDYVKRDYKNILILARVDPDMFRRRIERSVIKEFKSRRYNVSGSTEFVTPELMKDTISLKNKVVEMGFDALLVVTYLGEISSISENIVFNGNIYSFFGAFPVYNLETRGNKTRYFQTDFYRLDGRGTQWRSGFAANLDGDPDFGLDKMSVQIRKRIERDKIL
jgi:hypothetical protein